VNETRLDATGALAWLPGAVVLDVRAEDAFAAGHLAGAGRMSEEEFGPRRPELPPRTARVLVVHDEPARARAAARALMALEYRHVAWLSAPISELPGGCASREPSAALWCPSPFLARVRGELAPGRALDFASGAGRESVYLARHGWDVDAWDHDPAAHQRAVALAAREGLTLATRVVDLERVQDLPPPRPWDTIVVCRYLHRAAFPWLERALVPGGTLVYETFRRGQELHGRPRQARFLLEPGELALAFPSLRVERYEESNAPGGPVMAHLLARRPRDDASG
jgi:rhodanese-related sulfurtransferase